MSANSDSYDLGILIKEILEVVLPFTVLTATLTTLIVRHCKLIRAGLFYNKQKSLAVLIKRIFIGVWVAVIAVQAGGLWITFRDEGSDESVFLYIRDDETRALFTVLYAFQALVLLYCQYVLGVEVRCKVNSLIPYTRLLFWSFAILYAGSFFAYVVPEYNQKVPSL